MTTDQERSLNASFRIVGIPEDVATILVSIVPHLINALRDVRDPVMYKYTRGRSMYFALDGKQYTLTLTEV